MSKSFWTDEIVLEVQKRLETESPETVALDMGRSIRAIKDCRPNGRLTPGKRQKIRANHRMAFPVRIDVEVVAARPTPEMIRDRDVRAALPHHDLTASFFGDPPLGLSALDGRRA